MSAINILLSHVVYLDRSNIKNNATFFYAIVFLEKITAIICH